MNNIYISNALKSECVTYCNTLLFSNYYIGIGLEVFKNGQCVMVCNNETVCNGV